MRSFFRSLEREGVEFLLVSGQAAILYGASMFSEDIDLWVRPSSENLERLRAALARCRARVYKLTPPLTLAMARKGHGFHFTIPEDAGLEMFLDVMARPPRVGSFGHARRREVVMETDWGHLPVVSIPDLVLLKRTRRLRDYDVISNLVDVRLRREGPPSRRLLRWSLENTFRLEDVARWMEIYPTLESLMGTLERPAIRALAAGEEGEAASLLLQEIGTLQQEDVEFWRPVIQDLRRLRQHGELLEVGTPVP